MKTCETCGKEIPEGSEGCFLCSKSPEGLGTAMHGSVLKKFRGYATKEGKKFSGVFEALDEQDARRQLLDSGFEFVRVEPVVFEAEVKNDSHFSKFQLFVKKSFTHPIMVVVPIVFIFIGILLYQNTLVALRDQMAASWEAARRATYPQVGDQIIVLPGYFLTENKMIFNTALTHQRSGNIGALKALFAGQRGMMVTKEGMVFIYEGRDGVVPKAAKVRFKDSQEILYVDHDGIDIKRSKEEAARREAMAASDSKAGRSGSSAVTK